MYKETWEKSHESICSISFINKSGINIETISGFKAKDKYILTDNSIYIVRKFETVIIRFNLSDGYSTNLEMEFDASNFKSMMLESLNDVKLGFGIIQVNDKRFRTIPSLVLTSQEKSNIGSSIAILGCNSDHRNIALKTGVLSSKFQDTNRKEFLEIDCTINQGNAGSPIVDIDSNQVIGILGYKLAEMTQSYNKIKKIMNNNLAILKKSQGKFEIHEIDPVQVLIANQNQMKHIVNEMYKSTNIHIGNALNIKHVNEFFEELSDVEEFISGGPSFDL